MNNQKIANNNESRIKIDEKLQKELFYKIFKKFCNVPDAASYLNITPSSFSKYYRCKTRYLPYAVVQKIVTCLNITFPQILESGNLTEIRLQYMKKAHPLLGEKYGVNWAKKLTIRRNQNKITLNDLPDNTYVYIEPNYRKSLLQNAVNLFNTESGLMKKLSLSTSRFVSWYKGEQKDYRSNKIGVSFIPLNKLKEISSYLCEYENTEFSMDEISKHVLMYRLKCGNPIRNVILPIKESPQIVRLLFHLLGDGYGGMKGESASYKNTCQELLDEVVRDLQIFGDVQVYRQNDQIKFHRIIADIIKNYYSIQFKTFDSFISPRIKGLNKELLCHGIRAFADDEATAYPSFVRITSANYTLLTGIHELVSKYLKIESNIVKEQYSLKATYKKTYYFDLKDLREYKNKIGFTHPKKAAILNNARKTKRKKRIDYL